MKNAWELLASEELCQQMKLIGCDKKYISGSASDFEKFRELCAVFFMLEGNDTADKFLSDIKKALGKEISFDHIHQSNAKRLWRDIAITQGVFLEDEVADEIYDEKSNSKNPKHAKTHCVEKDKYFQDFFDINSLLEGLTKNRLDSLEKICIYIKNQGIYKIKVSLSEADFVKPNRYSAERIIKNIINGEKYNFAEYNLLLCQIICESIFVNSNRILQLHLDCRGFFSTAIDLINYLSSRKLRARIFLSVNTEISVEDIKTTCLLSNEYCFATPVFIKKETDTEERSAVFLQSLSRVYPSGNVLILN